jgi:hypothetical protein
MHSQSPIDHADAELGLRVEQERISSRNAEMALRRGAAEQLYVIGEQSAVEYAKSVIQAGLFLNGGAIVALPAITSLIKADLSPVFLNILCAGFMFAAGLIASWIASIIAYFAVCHISNYHFNEAAEITERILRDYAQDETTRNFRESQRLIFETASARSIKKYIRWRWSGVSFCTLSLLLFILGSGAFGWALMSQTINVVVVEGYNQDYVTLSC